MRATPFIDTYIDRATTGTNDQRAAFQKMLRDSHKGNFQYVIVYKLDRFSRNRYDSAMNKALLKKNGVKVLSACENITDSPEGIILESMVGCRILLRRSAVTIYTT